MNSPQYITDKKGKKVSVVLSLKDYKKILEDLEEFEDIKLYDAVKARNEDTISLEDYIAKRKKPKK
jgi:PHD/YefM family antitoxin component YafN of YafNO toxin-antitoxin module